MFLNVSKFKKAVKKAYEGNGIHIMRLENVYAFDAGWWFMEVHKDHFTKGQMAAVIEIVGMLPDEKHGIYYRKNESPQEEIVETYDIQLAEEIRKFKDQYKTTNVLFRTQKTMVEVLQHVNNNGHILLPQQFLEMLDFGKTEQEEDMFSDYGLTSQESNKIVWASDQMFIACRKRKCRYYGEETFMKQLHGVDLTWHWNEVEEIPLVETPSCLSY